MSKSNAKYPLKLINCDIKYVNEIGWIKLVLIIDIQSLYYLYNRKLFNLE